MTKIQISDRGGGPRVPWQEVDRRCFECSAKRTRKGMTTRGVIETCSEVEVVSGEDNEVWDASIYDVRDCPRGRK